MPPLYLRKGSFFVQEMGSITVTHFWNRIATWGTAASSTPQACGRFGGGTQRYHPRRRRAVWVEDFVRGMGSGLSCRGGTLEFVAEVLKVFLADL